MISKYFCLRLSAICKHIFKEMFTGKHILVIFYFLRKVSKKLLSEK